MPVFEGGSLTKWVSFQIDNVGFIFIIKLDFIVEKFMDWWKTTSQSPLLKAGGRTNNTPHTNKGPWNQT